MNAETLEARHRAVLFDQGDRQGHGIGAFHGAWTDGAAWRLVSAGKCRENQGTHSHLLASRRDRADPAARRGRTPYPPGKPQGDHPGGGRRYSYRDGHGRYAGRSWPHGAGSQFRQTGSRNPRLRTRHRRDDHRSCDARHDGNGAGGSGAQGLSQFAHPAGDRLRGSSRGPEIRSAPADKALFAGHAEATEIDRLLAGHLVS